MSEQNKAAQLATQPAPTQPVAKPQTVPAPRNQQTPKNQQNNGATEPPRNDVVPQKINLPQNAKAQTVTQVAPQRRAAPVIPLPTSKVVSVAKKAPRTVPSFLKRHVLVISMLVCVVLPGLFGASYFLFIASDRYAASAGFSVRSMDSAVTGGDFLGAISGLSSVGSTTADSYIILEFLQSRELVEKLIEDADFKAAYSSEKVDFFYRLNLDQPMEEIVDYWRWMINASYDNAADLIEFEVQAFTAEDAEKVAVLITQYAQELINSLSERARQDAVKFAEREVSLAEVRLTLIRDELRKFRTATNSLDPTATAAALMELTTQIESQIISKRAELTVLRESLGPKAPQIRDAEKQIAALQNELEAKRSEINTESATSNLAEILSNYERLNVEQEFAQQAYAVALSSLERSRAEADRQQRFLAVYRDPILPDSAIYPYRALNATLSFAIAFLAWGIGALLFSSVRDHLR